MLNLVTIVQHDDVVVGLAVGFLLAHLGDESLEVVLLTLLEELGELLEAVEVVFGG